MEVRTRQRRDRGGRKPGDWRRVWRGADGCGEETVMKGDGDRQETMEVRRP